MVYSLKKQKTLFLVVFVTCFIYSQEDSSYATIHNLCEQAKACINAERYRDAIPLLHEALAIDHKNIHAQLYLAHALSSDHNYTDALAVYKKIAPTMPESADIAFNMGMCAYQLNSIPEAISYFEQALERNTESIYAHLHLIGALEKNHQYTQAMTACKRFLSIKPLHREGLLSAGIIAKQLDLFEDAAWYYRTLYNQYPEDVQAIVELAAVLITLEEYEEALTLYTKALSLKPESLSVFYNLGFTLKKLGYIDEAIAIYKQILTQKPEYALAHFSLGLAYLTKGNFQAGLPEYEWRWKVYQEEPHTKPIPQWDGSSLTGKKIYVYAEQGYGDTFQCVRYLLELKKMGAYIVFAPQQGLIPLMKLVPHIDEVRSLRDTVSGCDYQVALMSLPLLCKTTLDTIPAENPYLNADPQLVKLWQQIFDTIPSSTYRIGICWHGNSQYKDQSLRRAVQQKSCPLSLFAMLAEIPNVQLFSLQKVSGLSEINDLEDGRFVTLFADTIDTAHGRFMDTAAIISHLDLVITVDTAIAHLAAALGIETWNLLPEPADWRWMINRSDTPWYPMMRLFRQSKRGNWQGLMYNVQQALKEKTNTLQIQKSA